MLQVAYEARPAAAFQLVRLGADLVLVGRNREKTEQVGRALRTAEIVAETLGWQQLELSADERLTEMAWGRWDGLTAAERSALDALLGAGEIMHRLYLEQRHAEALEALMPGDFSILKPGRERYSMLLAEDGGIGDQRTLLPVELIEPRTDEPVERVGDRDVLDVPVGDVLDRRLGQLHQPDLPPGQRPRHGPRRLPLRRLPEGGRPSDADRVRRGNGPPAHLLATDPGPVSTSVRGSAA